MDPLGARRSYVIGKCREVIMSSKGEKHDEALAVLTVDLVKQLLSQPDNLPKVTSLLAERIRELSGAHAVILAQCRREAGETESSRPPSL